jgi:hypothetical protein
MLPAPRPRSFQILSSSPGVAAQNLGDRPNPRFAKTAIAGPDQYSSPSGAGGRSHKLEPGAESPSPTPHRTGRTKTSGQLRRPRPPVNSDVELIRFLAMAVLEGD